MAAATFLLVGSMVTPVRAWTSIGYLWPNVGALTYWNYSVAGSLDNGAWAWGFLDWDSTATPISWHSDSTRGNEDVGGYSVNNTGVTWDGLTISFHSGAVYNYAQSELNDHFTDGYIIDKRRSVAEHELGHALGLGHQAGSDLMNAFTCGTNSRWCTFMIKKPTTDDVNGINALY